MARRKSLVVTSGPPAICANDACKATYRTSAVVGTSVTRGGPMQRLCPRCARQAKAAKKLKRKQQKQDDTTLD